jgi:hypothetical protein
MKTTHMILKYTKVICLLFLACCSLTAQEAVPTPEFKEATVRDLNQLMIDLYIFPEVGKQTAAHLDKQLASGHFDQFETMEAFAEALTAEVRSISKDKHMLIWPNKPKKAQENTPERFFEERQNRMDYMRNNAGGFKEAKIMEGNVGYFDLRNFSQVQLAAAFADGVMKLLSGTDAIIIDMRKNGGGSPDMVQYLCSYFFDEKVHLNSLYFREGDRTTDFWSLDEVGGTKLPDLPLFVMTSDQTFSGAEEFSYNMQTQKRATLVGQTTRGGANPGRSQPINEKLTVFIPMGKAVNPITKTNWEGVGVVPEVQVSPEETMDRAYELAKAAAEAYRTKNQQAQQAMGLALVKQLDELDPITESEVVYQKLKHALGEGFLTESLINNLGYEYLNSFKKPLIAEAMLRANALFFPESANAHDSYGEALAVNGKLKASVASYQRAVDVAKSQNDPGVDFYQGNLDKVKAKMD